MQKPGEQKQDREKRASQGSWEQFRVCPDLQPSRGSAPRALWWKELPSRLIPHCPLLPRAKAKKAKNLQWQHQVQVLFPYNDFGSFFILINWQPISQYHWSGHLGLPRELTYNLRLFYSRVAKPICQLNSEAPCWKGMKLLQLRAF